MKPQFNFRPWKEQPPRSRPPLFRVVMVVALLTPTFHRFDSGLMPTEIINEALLNDSVRLKKLAILFFLLASSPTCKWKEVIPLRSRRFRHTFSSEKGPKKKRAAGRRRYRVAFVNSRRRMCKDL
ncbi:hypothetical protein OUZ56_007789 [Daphnia magna]|uniref:Uncharacterized protein n=1 Tax=Daphnia magna TaxID=35525 RepID=A0ABR0ABE9_9CRUS|nr:hypothetical protein OUZ56_007789 [Daphnia magna]